MLKCPLCDREVVCTPYPRNQSKQFSCETCGNFTMSYEAEAYAIRLGHKEKAMVSSYTYERTLNKSTEIMIITSTDNNLSDSEDTVDFNYILECFPKTAAEKLNRSLVNLSYLTEHFGKAIQISTGSYPLFFAENVDEMKFLISEMASSGYVKVTAIDNFLITYRPINVDILPVSLVLTVKGENKCHELDKKRTDLPVNLQQKNDENQKMSLFLSVITEEKKLAHSLQSLIENAFPDNLDIFLFTHKNCLLLGTEWNDGIREGVLNANIMITLCSKVSINRPWIIFESGAAWLKGIPIVPYCHSGLALSELTHPLNRKQGGYLNNANDIEKLFFMISKLINIEPNIVNIDEFVNFVRNFEKNYESNFNQNIEENTTFNRKHQEIIISILSSYLKKQKVQKFNLKKMRSTSYGVSFENKLIGKLSDLENRLSMSDDYEHKCLMSHLEHYDLITKMEKLFSDINSMKKKITSKIIPLKKELIDVIGLPDEGTHNDEESHIHLDNILDIFYEYNPIEINKIKIEEGDIKYNGSALVHGHNSEELSKYNDKIVLILSNKEYKKEIKEIKLEITKLDEKTDLFFVTIRDILQGIRLGKSFQGTCEICKK